jgi:hypothetical protein
VAFGVNGSLAKLAEEPVDLAVKLELNEWNGAVAPRVVLDKLFSSGATGAAAGRLSDDDWWGRADGERRAALEPWPPAGVAVRGSAQRAVVDRRNGSGVAAVAALVSTGDPVLVVACDSARRRGLVEQALPPARFGTHLELSDWNALSRDPLLPSRFRHVVCVDRPPFAHLERLLEHGTSADEPGYLHLAWSDAQAEFAIRVHELEWPGRECLAAIFRALREASAALASSGEALRDVLASAGGCTRSPEALGRSLRVLEELGLVECEQNGATRTLVVVSSEATELERSPAFVAYKARREEGIRYLSAPRQAS